MKRLHVSLLACVVVSASACSDSGQSGGHDAALDLALPAQVTHIGVNETVCCLVTADAAWRAMYLASPAPGVSDALGRDVPTKGELHIVDAYGTDITLAKGVPRAGYIFNEDATLAFYMAPAPAAVPKDNTFGLMYVALSTDTLGTVNPITVIPRGLADDTLTDQSFFSPSGKYLILGVAQKGIMYSSDLTVVDVATATVLFSLPNGSFNYIEAVTGSDTLVYQNSDASTTPGVPSLVGLYALPLAQGAAGTPARIDTRTVTYSLTADDRRVVYTRYDGSLWMYDLIDQSHVQLASNVVTFTLGGNADGPLVWVGTDLAIHVTALLQPELTKTPPNSTDAWTTFLFSPSGQDLYFFNDTNSQNADGDLYRLNLAPGNVSPTPQLIEHTVSQTDFTFISDRVRYLRGLDGRGDIGELVSANLDGSDVQSISRNVAVGSLHVANPQPVPPTMSMGNPPRGPIDLMTPDIPPVYVYLADAARDQAQLEPLFDDSQPIVGSLTFARGSEAPVVLDSAVHVGSYHFSPDGYTLVYAGGATLNTKLAEYLGTLRIFQTLVDQSPVPPMLTGVSEVSEIRARAFFVAAPGAPVPGVYFVRY